jgi:heme oxygenase
MPDGLMRPTRSSIHQRLRESTRADHLRLERLLNLQDPELTRGGYGRVLAAFHAFYAPLEAQFRRHQRAMSLPLDFELPCRTPLLVADLAVLGLPPHEQDEVPMSEIRTPSEFAGRLYVVEGAALGGQMLARHLADTWGMSRDSGAAFFSGSGPIETGRRWALVLTWLERVPKSAGDARDMIATASATFRALEYCVTAQAHQP